MSGCYGCRQVSLIMIKSKRLRQKRPIVINKAGDIMNLREVVLGARKRCLRQRDAVFFFPSRGGSHHA